MTFNLFLFLWAAAVNQSSNLPVWISWLSFPATFIGLAGFVVALVKLITVTSKAHISRVPLRESSEIEIPTTEKLNLNLEAPAMTIMAGSGLDYQLINAANGQAVELLPTPAMLMGRTGVSTMTFPVREFQAAETGKHLLKVSGFNPDVDYSRYALIVSRPTALKLLLSILGLIFSLLLFVGGLTISLIVTNAQK